MKVIDFSKEVYEYGLEDFYLLKKKQKLVSFVSISYIDAEEKLVVLGNTTSPMNLKTLLLYLIDMNKFNIVIKDEESLDEYFYFDFIFKRINYDEKFIEVEETLFYYDLK